METYKKGISLIVLVITIIILAILASAVILTLSNTNIISKANSTTFKSDMANIKAAYELYVASEFLEDKDSIFDKTTLNITSSDVEFTEIFGENIPKKYEDNLAIVAGRVVYKTANTQEVSILKELNMAITVIPETMQIGDLVEYTPSADSKGSYTGATYVMDEDESSETYNTYIESTTKYTPGTMKWVYLGQDEYGNALLTSQEATSFKMTIGGQDGWVTGPDRMDTLCNTLYGNSVYGEARNMKVEDANRLLGYTGDLGSYLNSNNTIVTTKIAKTIGALETEVGTKIQNRQTPRLSTEEFEDYLSDYYTYTGTDYKVDTTDDEYRVIFKKANGTTNQTVYWLSSSYTYARFWYRNVIFGLHHVGSGMVYTSSLFFSTDSEENHSFALRPVVVLESNIQFGDKNSAGEWTLLEI